MDIRVPLYIDKDTKVEGSDDVHIANGTASECSG